jgi:2-methylcitrate dehydratase PrpD
MEGKTGYLNAFANTTENAQEIVKHLGKRWEIMNAGFKPYPVCAFNQTPVIAMLNMVNENDIDHRNIRRIEIKVNPYEYHYAGMNYRGPFRTVGATLMSTPFCLAVACVDRDVTLAGIHQFESPAIVRLIEKIEHIPDDEMPRFSCSVFVEMDDGKAHEKEMKVTPDYYNFDMERDIELVKRVTGETGVPQGKVDKMIRTVKGLEKAVTVEELIKTLSSRP